MVKKAQLCRNKKYLSECAFARNKSTYNASVANDVDSSSETEQRTLGKGHVIARRQWDSEQWRNSAHIPLCLAWLTYKRSELLAARESLTSRVQVRKIMRLLGSCNGAKVAQVS